MNESRRTARFSLADLMVAIALISLVLALAVEAGPPTLLCSLPFLATSLITRAGGNGVLAAPVAGLLVWVVPYVGVFVWFAFATGSISGSDFANALQFLVTLSICGLVAGLFCGGLGFLLGVVWRRTVIGSEHSSPEAGAARAPTPPPITPPPPQTSNAPPSPPAPPV
jgi:hypothetical protein